MPDIGKVSLDSETALLLREAASREATLAAAPVGDGRIIFAEH